MAFKSILLRGEGRADYGNAAGIGKVKTRSQQAMGWGDIWPAVCFCMGYKLRMVVTFMKDRKNNTKGNMRPRRYVAHKT